MQSFHNSGIKGPTEKSQIAFFKQNTCQWPFLYAFVPSLDSLVSKFNVGLKTLLHQGLSEPEFYGDLVYRF